MGLLYTKGKLLGIAAAVDVVVDARRTPVKGGLNEELDEDLEGRGVRVYPG